MVLSRRIGSIAEFCRKNRNVVFISVLFLVSFIIRFCYLPSFPIYGDEAAYAEIIDEFIRSPTIIPHFLGHSISWKPPLGFVTYSAVITGLYAINPNIPVEIAYRIPPLIFGVLSTLSLYFLVRKLYDEETAFLSSLIFATTAISVVLSETILLDQLMLFLLICGIMLFIDGRKDPKYLYYAGLVGGLLFLTKSIMAFMLPALAIAYYVGDKEIRNNPAMRKAFLVSLLAVPLAMVFYAIVFFALSPSGRGGDITVSYVYDFLRAYVYNTSLFSHTAEFIKLTAVWSILFFSGLLTMKISNREDRFVFIWLILMLVLLGAGQFYPWYYLPILPPFAMVCAKSLMQIKRKKFFVPVVMILLIFSLPYFANKAFMDTFLSPMQVNSERAQVGMFLREKNDVLSITQRGVPEIVFYKFHGEKQPDYPGFKMVVLNPFEICSYTAYEYFADIVFGGTVQNLTSSEDVKSIIANNSRNEYVVMDAGVYNVYSSSPWQDYSLVFNSSEGSYVVLHKVT
ncbi:MAG: phospholipid carrier-dependent glycosyltransferase [Candidatus Fermentimicrarchaeum limneticum]|uniref:Phospholipid carrier-dependent glycosyltransferase n=1 Tax=Fermentimicrarchaeum limneticum TaxID=2795018 RepID=A0A7D6BSC1_FERL1|nr:MAG: phospholipid carrier-dependent glycosyltransferase [Candidatus Fermentimicrarchaeum limneticum]